MRRKKRKKRKKNRKIGDRTKIQTSAPSTQPSFLTLQHRTENDPMRLRDRVAQRLKHYFSTRGLTYPSEQHHMLMDAADAILSAAPGTVTAVPLVPGGGKSTLIRALLTVFSEEFRNDTPIAQSLGGVVVVVEKSSEAHELETICNSEEGPPMALVIESANDFNLGQGQCFNGTATHYEDCPKRKCPDYEACPLMYQAKRTMETPILILLHARYPKFMENMTPLLTWYPSEQDERKRTLLLVDELPSLFETNVLCLRDVNDAESELDELRPFHHPSGYILKREILRSWWKVVRSPFLALRNCLSSKDRHSGVVTTEDMAKAGFSTDALRSLLINVDELAPYSKASKVLHILLDAEQLYVSLENHTRLASPRLRRLAGDHQPATFIFSGTATLAPELSSNPDVTMLDNTWTENYSRLEILVQRGDVFHTTKSAMASQQNCMVAVQWLLAYLPELIIVHPKILLVTYKSYATHLWAQLEEFHDHLIPHIDSSDQPQESLPYFGGMNGSNRYQEATCVICLGLHRFEPTEYLYRTIALDQTGAITKEMQDALVGNIALIPERLPAVMGVQDITLANDLAQAIFRSALRRHDQSTKILVWLFQTPNGVLGYLQDFFPGASIREVTEVPDTCYQAKTINRNYNGASTHASKLLRWLTEWITTWDGTPISVKEIQQQAGLSQKHYKEARKHKEVKAFFDKHLAPSGSGKNAKYYKRDADLAPIG